MCVYILLLFLLLSSGCAKGPFLPHPQPPLPISPQLSKTQLLEKCWLAPGHRYLCRHSGVLKLLWREIPLEGMIRFDTTLQQARLVGMDSMGVKLFDLSVTATDHTLNYLLPLLEEHPQLPEMVASSVRHIFLTPNPQPEDRLTRVGEDEVYQYVLSSARDEEVIFTFGGDPVHLQQKTYHFDRRHGRVDYYEYGDQDGDQNVDQDGMLVPAGIVLEDDSGYRLTLWVQEIREL
ncbi:MAG: DUF3261 domain-containing protein [Desulfuromonas sp.]|nr:DUF3261 domain-containing protein [Desulfuromonas sp.]